jgi:drug/metabolite transporter (DMT)-like permease
MATAQTETQAETPVAPALRGYVILLASTLVLSTTGVLIKFLLNDFGLEPLALAFWRVLLVAVASGLALALFKPALLKLHARDLPLFAFYGLVGVGLHQIAWITSVATNGVGVATVLVYIQPAIVAVISWRFLRESFDRVRLLALVLTLGGMVLVSRAYEIGNVNLNWLGILTGVGTGFTWATYALLGRYTARRYSAWTAVSYSFLFGALFLLPLQFFVHDLFSLGGSVEGWSLLLFLALGPTLGGFGLYTIGLSHLPASVATLIGTLEPVFSIVMAYFLFGEVLNVFQIVGAGLILWSVIMLRPRQGA